MTDVLANESTSETRNGMRVVWDAAVPMRDGSTLRADVFLPVDATPVPVIMTLGCYAKGIAFQDGYAQQWKRMVSDYPEIEASTSGSFQCWEVADPERWVPRGYAVVRVDSRGAGSSAGTQHLWGQQEILDYYDAIEWAGTQAWSDGNVGLLGISYYAANQWRVAALQPPHLRAIVPWEGASDLYRELYFHGGIRSIFLDSWSPRQLAMQHGYGDRGLRNPNTGKNVAGDDTLTEAELIENRVDVVGEVRAHPLDDSFHTDQAVDWTKVTVPVLSSANWGGQGLHLRGNLEGFTSTSGPAWLEVHGLEHWTHFYTDYGVDLQMRFLDYFLKHQINGWEKQPRVLLQVRHLDRFVARTEAEWPLARTDWQRWFLDARQGTLSRAAGDAAETQYHPTDSSARFITPPFENETEITGPIAATLFISAESSDTDLFLVVGVIDPDGNEVTFRGAMDPNTPVAQGWLRASHRRTDSLRSTPYRPFHDHKQLEPLVPNQVYQVDIEIWPTSVVIPAGYRLRLDVRGRDYEYEGAIDETAASSHRYPSRGCGPFQHPFGDDRPEDTYGAPVTVHTGALHPSFLLLPVVPAAVERGAAIS